MKSFKKAFDDRPKIPRERGPGRAIEDIQQPESGALTL